MRLGLLFTFVFALAGLPAFASAGPPAVKLKKPLAAAEADAATALASQVRNGRFIGAAERDPANGRLFLHLAATHDDPAVIAASLRAMSYTWRRQPRRGGKRPVMDADYIAVVKARLGASEDAVRAQALRAARLPIGGKKPDVAVIDQVLTILARPAVPDQLAALTSVANVSDFSSNRATRGPLKAKVTKAVLPLLDSKEPIVVATALYRLAKAAFPGMPEARALAGHSLRLAKHPEPAVRGESLRLAAGLAGKKPDNQLIGRLTMALKDPNGYVRAVAVELLTQFKHVPSTHAIMGLIEDEAAAVHKLSGPKTLDGRDGSRRFRAESARRVDVVALRAVDRLTNGIGPDLKSTPKGKNKKKARAKAVKDAKAWYGKHKGKLPAAPAAGK